ncbi:MAG: signal peptidase II [Acidobacteriia bacterium]|nr:signal peptidase II [Terriglobia bacterium]
MPIHLSARLKWLWLTLVVVVADRAAKVWCETQTPEGYRREVVRHFFYLVHSRNPGIAFGIFADAAAPWVRLALIAGSLVVIGALAWLLVSGGGGRMVAAGLALLLGGATGNLTDRILHGGVTDFIEVWIGTYRWPAFNVADSAITIGAILVILDMLMGARHRAE